MSNPCHKFCIEMPENYDAVIVEFTLKKDPTYRECMEAFQNFLRGVGYVPPDDEEIERAY